jgi:hypothetical protein
MQRVSRSHESESNGPGVVDRFAPSAHCCSRRLQHVPVKRRSRPANTPVDGRAYDHPVASFLEASSSHRCIPTSFPRRLPRPPLCCSRSSSTLSGLSPDLDWMGGLSARAAPESNGDNERHPTKPRRSPGGWPRGAFTRRRGRTSNVWGRSSNFDCAQEFDL